MSNVLLTNISDQEFSALQRFIYNAAGISLADSKRSLVCARLMKRLRYHNLPSYDAYLRMITRAGQALELQTAIDLLTTNETYFFREAKHFEFLATTIVPSHRSGRALRIWSAACSTGEEPYSIAMVLKEHLGSRPWDILASDISSRVLEHARQGRYNIERAEKIPKQYLAKYCLKGVGTHAGMFLIDQHLRSRIRFRLLNLNQELPDIGLFDVIFLRNVMIYFDACTKRRIVERLATTLRPGGHFFVGHSESLLGLSDEIKPVQPAVYQKPLL